MQEELEGLLGVPLVEGYGTSETGIVSSNPPDGVRKRGTVGLSPDGDVAVVDAHGTALPAGAVGEVAVGGPTVIAGYEGHERANRAAFRDGWYRTGDLGVLDADGYLTLAGRVSETINRGGEKISPREVDAVLLEHPAVAEAVTFALPHPTLGQDVAAAVRLQGGGVSEPDLRRFLLQRLTPFKVPRRIVIAAALPKGPTGKPLRQGMADHFGLAARKADRPADDLVCTPMERTLLALFREALQGGHLGLEDDFFASGGDSLSAVDLIGRIEDELKLSVPLLALMEMPTARQLAGRLVHHPPDATRDVLGVNVGGRQRPVFGICGRYGYAVRLLLVGREMGAEQPFYGLQPPDMDWERAGRRTIQEMAAHYIGRIREIQARGPYRLLGTSFGGLVVFEMALQLQAAGEAVDFLGLLDTQPTTWRWNGRTDRPSTSVLAEDEEAEVAPVGAVEAAGIRVARAHIRARDAYILERPFDGELTYLYCAGETVTPRRDRRRVWRRFATRGVRLLAVPGVHGSFHQEPQFSAVCEVLRACLSGAPPPSAGFAEVFARRYRVRRRGDGEFIEGMDGSVSRRGR